MAKNNYISNEVLDAILYILRNFTSDKSTLMHNTLLEKTYNYLNNMNIKKFSSKDSFRHYFSSALNHMLENEEYGVYQVIVGTKKKKEYYYKPEDVEVVIFYNLLDVILKSKLPYTRKNGLLVELSNNFNMFGYGNLEVQSLDDAKSQIDIISLKKLFPIYKSIYNKQTMLFNYDRNDYVLSPYYLFIFNDMYYVFGCNKKTHKLQHFEINKLKNIRASTAEYDEKFDLIDKDCPIDFKILRNVSHDWEIGKLPFIPNICYESDKIVKMSEVDLKNTIYSECEKRAGNSKLFDTDSFFFEYENADNIKDYALQKANDTLKVWQLNYILSKYIENNVLETTSNISFTCLNTKTKNKRNEEVNAIDIVKENFGEKIKIIRFPEIGKLIEYKCEVKVNRNDFIDWAVSHYDIIEIEQPLLKEQIEKRIKEIAKKIKQ